MNAQITPKDLDMLSAYLDGQLGEKERVRVETRLQNDESYRQELESIRHIRLLLRHLPQRRAPRNFMLSAQTAAQIKPVRSFRWVPALRVTTALASFLLIVSFAGELLFARAPLNTAPSAMEAPLAAEAQKSLGDTGQSTAGQVPPVIEWGLGGSAVANGIGGGGDGSQMGMGGGGDAPALSASGPQVNIQIATPEGQAPMVAAVPLETNSMEPTATPAGETMSAAAAETPTSEPPSLAPQAIATPEPSATLEPMRAAETQPLAKSDNLILGVPSADLRGEIIATPEVLIVPDQTEPEAPAQPLKQLRIVQIALATIAAGTGLWLYLLRRKG